MSRLHVACFPEEQDAVGQGQEFEDCDGHGKRSTHPLTFDIWGPWPHGHGFGMDFDSICVIFLWYFYGISMVFLWYFYDISMGLLWDLDLFHGWLVVGIPTTPLWKMMDFVSRDDDSSQYDGKVIIQSCSKAPGISWTRWNILMESL